MMKRAEDPLLPSEATSTGVQYRSIGNSWRDEEALINANGMAGDSICSTVTLSGSSTTRRAKPKLIFGRAWGRSVQWLRAKKKGEQAYRLVDRDGPFHQSNGKWNIRRLKTQAEMQKLISLDPFHSFLNQSTFKIILRIMMGYLGLVLFFAILYTLISATLGCNLELSGIREGFLFSLETMTTVGYGTNDYLFGTCWIMLPMLSLQACIGLLIDAFLIGVLFARLSRPQTRAATVVFSKNAVIRRVRGESYFMFQVGELRKHQLLEIRVRCYALRHERLRCTPAGAGGGNEGNTRADSGAGFDSRRNSLNGLAGFASSATELDGVMPDQVFFQSHNMRLQHPDDELGGNLLLVLPQVVVHRIDAWSPMMPPPRWNSSHGPVQWGLHTDRAIIKAPWEDEVSSPDGKLDGGGGGGGAAAAAAATAAADALWSAGGVIARGAVELNDSQHSLPDPEESMSRKESTKTVRRGSASYWEDASISEFGFNVNERGDDHDKDNLGYVHRFPDLLKRWDDVDGDRGTWYEKMKRRLLRMEMERRRAEDLRKEAEEHHALSSNRLARAGLRRGIDRRASIMHIGGKPADNPEELTRERVPSLGKLSEGFEVRQCDPQTGRLSPPPTGLPPSGAPRNGESCGIGSSGSSGGGGPRLSAGQWFAREERKAIDAYLQDRELEVVVILEGTDTSTGSTVQARHSYCWEDMRWDRTFASCVTRGKDGACEVDYSKFHDTLPAPANCDDHGFIQSYA